MSQDFLNSLIKDNTQPTQNKDISKESIPDESAKENKTEKNIPLTTETKKEESKNTEENNKKNTEEEIDKIKNSIDNIISLTSQTDEKEKQKQKDDTSSKEENMNKINDPKEEDEKHPNKEQNKFDYIFPIPNNNTKLEESKNSDSSYYLYKIPQNNFGSLNLKIPDNLRPKNKDHQNQNHLNFNMSYFSPITISCSINAHSVKRSKLKQKEKEQEFFEKIIKISDVSNIQEFWEVFQHLLKPNQCPVGSDYHIFKKGIVPMWEDKLNKDGGKLSVLLTWKYANVIWEEVTFNFARGLLPYYDYVNGIVISNRPKFLVLSFWIKCGNNVLIEKIRSALSGFLQAPSSNCFDFIPFH